MRRVLSLFFILSLIVMLLPLASAADMAVGELTLSQQSYAPAEDGRLYIYLPVQSGKADCELTIFDGGGQAVAHFSRRGLTRNVHTFIWDAKPAAGNAAGYPADTFVPEGVYTIEAVCTGDSTVTRSATVRISPYGEAARPERGIPNYSGDHELDYLLSLVLQEIPTFGLSAAEQVREVYTWVQANFYRRGEKGEPWYDLEALAPRIRAEGEYSDSLRAAGQINYDVLDNLYISNAKELLLYRIGTCREFSALVQVLLARLGIECWICSGSFRNSNGSTMVHEWNYIRIDGQYYWSDVRIDNAEYERSGREKLYYDYFLESDTEVWSKRHSWDREEFPERSTATPPMGGAVTGLLQPTEPRAAEQPTLLDFGSTVLPSEEPRFRYPLLTLTDLSEKTASVNASPVLVNGTVVELEAYTIDGYNYFKLRDLAWILSGTMAQFDVQWIPERNAIGLYYDCPYVPVGDELSRSGILSAKAVPSPCQVFADGEPVELAAYLIGSNNYFRLRDIGILFDFAVEWDEYAGMIRIETSRTYRE